MWDVRIAETTFPGSDDDNNGAHMSQSDLLAFKEKK